MSAVIKDYIRTGLAKDIKAGLITGVVALPLAIAFAIASGVPPSMGLYTAVIAGILAAVFGGSKFSITGPTGAMSVIILSTAQKLGIEGLLVAGLLSGLLLLLFGHLKVGSVIKFIPLPVISGFTAGIGLLILLGQIPNLLGIGIIPKEHIWENLLQCVEGASSAMPATIFLGAATIAIMAYLPQRISKIKYLKNLPASFIALVIAIALGATILYGIPQVGDIPNGLPMPNILQISPQLIISALPAAFTIALLGAIESLLCAVVADSMTNTRHDSNKELFGQGIANVVIPFFGGIPATAAVARTAVNIREGAQTRMSAIYHSLFLLSTLYFMGGVASMIPKAFLAGVLIYVGAGMVNMREMRLIRKLSKSDFAVYVTTLLLTLLTDLVFAIQVGMVLAMFLLFIRIVKYADIKSIENYGPDDGLNKIINEDPALKDKVGILSLNGPFFFGVVSRFNESVKTFVDVRRDILILRMKHVSFMDSTATEGLKSLIRERVKKGSLILASGIRKKVAAIIDSDDELSRLLPGEHRFEHTRQALRYARENLGDR